MVPTPLAVRAQRFNALSLTNNAQMESDCALRPNMGDGVVHDGPFCHPQTPFRAHHRPKTIIWPYLMAQITVLRDLSYGNLLFLWFPAIKKQTHPWMPVVVQFSIFGPCTVQYPSSDTGSTRVAPVGHLTEFWPGFRISDRLLHDPLMGGRPCPSCTGRSLSKENSRHSPTALYAHTHTSNP